MQSLMAQTGNNLPTMQDSGSKSLEKGMTSVSSPGKSLGQRGLAGHSPWGRKVSDIVVGSPDNVLPQP